MPNFINGKIYHEKKRKTFFSTFIKPKALLALTSYVFINQPSTFSDDTPVNKKRKKKQNQK